MSDTGTAAQMYTVTLATHGDNQEGEMMQGGMHWLRSNRRALAAAFTQRSHLAARCTARSSAASAGLSGDAHRLLLCAPQTRGFAMHASIANQMDLLANRYDELSTELSKYVLLL